MYTLLSLMMDRETETIIRIILKFKHCAVFLFFQKSSLDSYRHAKVNLLSHFFLFFFFKSF